MLFCERCSSNTLFVECYSLCVARQIRTLTIAARWPLRFAFQRVFDPRFTGCACKDFPLHPQGDPLRIRGPAARRSTHATRVLTTSLATGPLSAQTTASCCLSLLTCVAPPNFAIACQISLQFRVAVSGNATTPSIRWMPSSRKPLRRSAAPPLSISSRVDHAAVRHAEPPPPPPSCRSSALLARIIACALTLVRSSVPLRKERNRSSVA